ncbi:PREDICTED: dnaJ homolog subfamily C member 28 isoform X1 [Acromyrmex echinatior]|uniref:DnaJ-like protein subfamily C member 28 n=1 Tax=Acromyrmex echinatior TaxID=103372 RepID=F4WZJ8_ACREC|nr:PREDICTED: dnaJ homolog subfamily C member 28 isoform X1 [Acromyrmex echinatior]EGI60273.1 DnaJ-like protein subfamily C member 28 [Acromyrmex echinatior]
MLSLNRLCIKPGAYFSHVSSAELILLISKRFVHRFNAKQTAKKLYETLGVAENCEDETLRLAFVHLAKRFHPDSGTPEADAIRFSEIESAYREIRRIRNAQKDEETSLEVEEFDIKHTAPQHRHYLTFNVGIGTPSKRQRLHTIERAQKAVDNIMEHRLKKLQAEERNTLIGMNKQKAKDIKTRYGIDRLVEDLIQEAMNKGEFSDLPGMGKPLKATNARNPYVDFVTHKLNQILIDNGFTPEWIQLSKEIREETEELKKKLLETRNDISELPLIPKDELIWNNKLEKFKTTTRQINNKIDKYNLLVPILQKQMLHVRLDKLAEKALSISPSKNIKKYADTSHENSKVSTSQDLLNLISNLFSKKIT